MVYFVYTTYIDTLANKCFEPDVVLVEENQAIIGLTEISDKKRDLEPDDTFINIPGYDQFYNVGRGGKGGVNAYTNCYLKATAMTFD